MTGSGRPTATSSGRLSVSGLRNSFAACGWLMSNIPVRGTSQHVEGSIADAAQPPVVLDEADNRRLIGDRVVDPVDTAVRGDDQERQAWSVAAARLIAGQARWMGAALTRPAERVARLAAS